MRKFLISCMLTVLAVPVSAEFQKGSQTLSLQLGGGGSDNEFQWSESNPNARDEEAADAGGAIGGQYIYYVKGSPAIGLGVDISHTNLGDHEASNTFPLVNSNSHFKPTTFLAIAKLAYPKGAFRPYIFAGVGVHNTDLLLEFTPVPGASWSPGGTTETRKVVDGNGTAAAVAWGIGGDWFPTEKQSFFLGLEYRGNYLASADYGVTNEGRALGFTSASGDLSYGNLYLRAGFKFGA